MSTKRLQFSTRISAQVARVWSVMLDQDSYREWTREFAEGSRYEGSWAQGEQIRFLAPNGDGMVARIAEIRLHEFVSIQHIGFISGGVTDTESDAVKSWAPAYENYSFRALPDGTEVIVAQDVTSEFEQFMLDTWPKALRRLKLLCEREGA